MKDETTIRFTKQMDDELIAIAGATLDGAFDIDNFDNDQLAAIKNALRFAFDAGCDFERQGTHRFTK